MALFPLETEAGTISILGERIIANAPIEQIADEAEVCRAKVAGPISVAMRDSGRSGSHPLRMVSTSYATRITCHGTSHDTNRMIKKNGLDPPD